jgi:hypothetical protein
MDKIYFFKVWIFSPPLTLEVRGSNRKETLALRPQIQFENKKWTLKSLGSYIGKDPNDIKLLRTKDLRYS